MLTTCWQELLQIVFPVSKKNNNSGFKIKFHRLCRKPLSELWWSVNALVLFQKAVHLSSSKSRHEDNLSVSITCFNHSAALCIKCKQQSIPCKTLSPATKKETRWKCVSALQQRPAAVSTTSSQLSLLKNFLSQFTSQPHEWPAWWVRRLSLCFRSLGGLRSRTLLGAWFIIVIESWV